MRGGGRDGILAKYYSKVVYKTLSFFNGEGDNEKYKGGGQDAVPRGGEREGGSPAILLKFCCQILFTQGTFMPVLNDNY